MNIENFLNTNTSDELLQEVFTFLDAQTLAKCRCVNHRFNANAQIRRLYTDEENKVRDAYENYQNQKQQNAVDQPAINVELEHLGRTIAHLQNSSPNTWFGWFVSLINTHSGMLSSIRALLEQIFPAIRTERLRQTQVATELKDANARQTQVYKRKDELFTRLSETRNVYESLKRIYVNKVLHTRNAERKIKEVVKEPAKFYANLGRLQRPISRAPDASSVPTQSRQQQNRIQHVFESRPIIGQVSRYRFLLGKWWWVPQREIVRWERWCVTCNKAHN